MPNRAIEQEEVEEYSEKIGAAHFDTSAKTGKGVEEIFLAITKAVLKKTKRDQKAKSDKMKKKGSGKGKSKKTAFGVEGDEGDDPVQLGEISNGGYGGIRLNTYNTENSKKKKK